MELTLILTLRASFTGLYQNAMRLVGLIKLLHKDHLELLVDLATEPMNLGLQALALLEISTHLIFMHSNEDRLPSLRIYSWYDDMYIVEISLKKNPPTNLKKKILSIVNMLLFEWIYMTVLQYGGTKAHWWSSRGNHMPRTSGGILAGNGYGGDGGVRHLPDRVHGGRGGADDGGMPPWFPCPVHGEVALLTFFLPELSPQLPWSECWHGERPPTSLRFHSRRRHFRYVDFVPVLVAFCFSVHSFSTAMKIIKRPLKGYFVFGFLCKLIEYEWVIIQSSFEHRWQRSEGDADGREQIPSCELGSEDLVWIMMSSMSLSLPPLSFLVICE